MLDMSREPGQGEQLTRTQERTLAALLEHGTIGEAAAAVGVSERTLHHWGFEASGAIVFR
jgi:hypothetical protein